MTDNRGIDRRAFVARSIRYVGIAAFAPGGSLLAGCGTASGTRPGGLPGSSALHLPPVVSPEGLTLVANPRPLEHDGVRSTIWTFGEGPIGPTIGARRGDRARITLRNELPEPTIVHWHGFRPPEAADGHPRLAVPPGASYEYDFEIDEPAGLYWYHPHPHHRTAAQTYLGLAGFILVRDEIEDGLGLPTGDREIPLLLQDRQLDRNGHVVYAPRGHDMMEGYLGRVPFVNGTRFPTATVGPGVHRLRILSAANARIFRLAWSDGRPLTIIGGDAGFLPEPVSVPFADIGTAERLDVLADFSDLPAGSAVTLKSLAFPDPSTMGMPGMGRMRGGGGMGGMGSGGHPQGTEMDLVQFAVREGPRQGGTTLPDLPAIPRLSTAEASARRRFRFDSAMMIHAINGRPFAMDRIDERIPFGATEVWTFVNESPFPHSVHLHATHFQVLSRSGGRDEVLPWETGWKDTVLVLPGETVDVIGKFDRHPGRYLLHCHNLEHEDMDMMMNFLIE
jgi:FtsP/CotA-like multicopper oxidase with cupredoxin domain